MAKRHLNPIKPEPGSKVSTILLLTFLLSSSKATFYVSWFRGLSQITFALRVGRCSEKCVVYYIKSAN